MSKRKENSQFDLVCKFINSLVIGAVYTCKELRTKYPSVHPDRLGYIHCALMEQYGEHSDRGANVIRRIKRGSYEVLAHIPDFVTYNMLEANYGYRRHDKPETSDWNNAPLRGIKWKASYPNPNSSTEVKTSNAMTDTFHPENVTVYVIKDKTVEPIDILFSKRHVYFSTGNFFENEQEAWEMLAIKLKTTVELLKAAKNFNESLEEQITNTTDAFTAASKNMSKQITIEDIRDKEVYFQAGGTIYKAIISSFEIICKENNEPKYTSVEVSVLSSSNNSTRPGDTEYFSDISKLYFTKEALMEKVSEAIDSL